MKVEIFLARSRRAGFQPELVIPMQFDHVLLRVYLADEDRHILIDPWADGIELISPEARELLLLGASEEWDGFYQIGPDGDLEAVEIAP